MSERTNTEKMLSGRQRTNRLSGRQETENKLSRRKKTGNREPGIKKQQPDNKFSGRQKKVTGVVRKPSDKKQLSRSQKTRNGLSGIQRTGKTGACKDVRRQETDVRKTND